MFRAMPTLNLIFQIESSVLPLLCTLAIYENISLFFNLLTRLILILNCVYVCVFGWGMCSHGELVVKGQVWRVKSILPPWGGGSRD